MEIKIIHEEERGGYTIVLEGEFFRYCRTYSELTTTMNSLIKAKYEYNLTNFI